MLEFSTLYFLVFVLGWASLGFLEKVILVCWLVRVGFFIMFICLKFF